MIVRRFSLLALAALAAVLLAGCVQLQSETVIDKDGGGNATFTMSMSKAVSDAIKQMQELDPQGGPGGAEMPAFDDLERDELEKRVKDFGVKITRFEKGEKDGRETVTVAYEFKDMKGLSAAMGALMSGSDGDQNGLGIFDAGDGNLVLRPTSYDLPDWEEDEEEAVDEATPDMDPAAMQQQMQVMGTLMGAIGELDISMKITVPGDIVSTNAPSRRAAPSGLPCPPHHTLPPLPSPVAFLGPRTGTAGTPAPAPSPGGPGTGPTPRHAPPPGWS